MQYRSLGRTGWQVSTVSFGAWAVGGTWGPVDDEQSLAALHRAVDRGVNFFDTADVYGDGRSERLLGRLRRERSETIYIATKAGRRLSPHAADGYNRENLTAFVDRSLTNLGVDALDLLQLHCPPTDVYYRPEVFEVLADLQRAGKVRSCGISVERVEEALKGIEYSVVQTVQIIFNLLRQRPMDWFLERARQRQVGVLARLPLSSGMLAGKMQRDQRFADDDHRKFNRQGAAFDRGETFSGVDYELGLEITEQIRALLPEGASMASWALRWILMQEGVSCAIPGAKRVDQVEENCAAADLPPLPDETMRQLRELYEARVKPLVHHYW